MERKPFTYSIGEFVDRLSIVSEKDIFALPGARQELDLYMKWLNDTGIDAYTILSIIRITQANAIIWSKEHELRQSVLGGFPLDKAGQIAEQIREHNKTRNRYMNELNKSCGDTQVNEKVQHLSEDIYIKYYGQSNK